MKNVRRINRYCGTKEVMDHKTGEYERAIVTKQVVQDRNFIKIFLPPEGEYRMRPKGMTLVAVDLFDYMCVVMNKDTNVAIVTNQEIEERIGMSSASVARAKDQLYEFDYIRKRASNIYMVNPEVAFHRDAESRLKADEEYRTIQKRGGKGK